MLCACSEVGAKNSCKYMLLLSIIQAQPTLTMLHSRLKIMD